MNLISLSAAEKESLPCTALRRSHVPSLALRLMVPFSVDVHFPERENKKIKKWTVTLKHNVYAFLT